jgi:proteasome assembly chaperone (PAC2) family protein
MSLRWEHEPALHDPVVVAAFTGWNDAADAASDAVDWLAARYGATQFASIDEQVHVDFQAQRPRVTLVDGALRDLTWPVYSLRAAATPDGEPDLVLVSGPEPNYDWRGFCGAVMDAAHGVGARTVVTLGSLLADAPHSRTPHVTGSSTDADMSDRIELSRSRYEGPTGIVGVLHDTVRNAGFHAASLWVPVPHYVAAPPNPGAIVALLHGVGRAVDLAVDTRELRVAAQAWEARVDAAVAEDDDLRTYVRTLEEQYDEEWRVDADDEVEIPDGDAIAEAFEEYLRDQGPS